MHSSHRARNTVFFANLLFSFALAVTAFTNSSFIKEEVSSSAVGFLYAIAAAITIFLLAQSTRFIGKTGTRTFFLFYGVLHAASLLCLVLPVSTAIHIGAFITYLFSGNVIIFSFDIFFQHVTTLKGRGRSRGLFLLLANVGWVCAPLVTAAIVGAFGLTGTYALALSIFAVVAVVIQLGLSSYTEKTITVHQTRLPLRQLINKPTVHAVIGANFILQVFYSWMVIYTPIYLTTKLGFSWDTIGILFSLMLTAFVILDYPLGRLADYLGSEKELAALGFLCMTAAVAGLAFLPFPGVLTVGLLLFFSRVGAATVEAMTEIHFFKITNGDDPRMLSVFRDLRPLAYIIGPLSGAFIIAFLPFQSIFIFLCVILLIGFYITLHMERKPAWWKRAHRQ